MASFKDFDDDDYGSSNPMRSFKPPQSRKDDDIIDDEFDAVSGTAFRNQLRESAKRASNYSQSDIERQWAEKERKFNQTAEMEKAAAKQREANANMPIQTREATQTNIGQSSFQTPQINKVQPHVIGATEEESYTDVSDFDYVPVNNIKQKIETKVAKQKLAQSIPSNAAKDKLSVITVLQSLFLFSSLICVIFYGISSSRFLVNELGRDGAVVWMIGTFLITLLVFIHVPFFVHARTLINRRHYIIVYYIFVIIFMLVIASQIFGESFTGIENSTPYFTALVACLLLELANFAILIALTVYMKQFMALAYLLIDEIDDINGSVPTLANMQKTVDLKIAKPKQAPKQTQTKKPTKSQLSGVETTTFNSTKKESK